MTTEEEACDRKVWSLKRKGLITMLLFGHQRRRMMRKERVKKEGRERRKEGQERSGKERKKRWREGWRR